MQGRLTLSAPHHKTVRKTKHPINFTLPQGRLNTLLIVYTSTARDLLCMDKEQPHLFLTVTGKPFSDATFSNWFKETCKTVPGAPIFTPNLMRTTFVEHVLLKKRNLLTLSSSFFVRE